MKYLNDRHHFLTFNNILCMAVFSAKQAVIIYIQRKTHKITMLRAFLFHGNGIWGIREANDYQ